MFLNMLTYATISFLKQSPWRITCYLTTDYV